LGQKIKKRKEKMRLTETRLKSLISEVMQEQALIENVSVLDVKDLLPKAKEMAATRGEEDRLDEAAGVLFYAAIALALPRILEWLSALAVEVFNNKKVINYLQKTVGLENRVGAEMLAKGLGKLAHNIHGIYLKTILYGMVKPLAGLSWAASGFKRKMPIEEQEELAEVFFICLLAVMLVIGTSLGLATIAAGGAKKYAGTLTIEALTSAVKAFEITEYAGVVPKVLGFLKKSAENH
jgi:hypothetical protein